jgi:hypothetical protein
MNPNVYQLLATERIAGFHREADQRRLAHEATRRLQRHAGARRRASGRANCEPSPA